MIYVFTGKGKGKTTAALGVALRALGADKKVLIIKFLKSEDSSEDGLIEKIDNFDIKSFGRKGFFLPQSKLEEKPELREQGIRPFEEVDKEKAAKGLKTAVKSREDYDVIILDEINIVLHYNLIKKEEVIDFLKSTNNTHIILTGRYCPDSIIGKADLVSNIKEVKHYYNKGCKPIKGIDL